MWYDSADPTCSVHPRGWSSLDAELNSGCCFTLFPASWFQVGNMTLLPLQAEFPGICLSSLLFQEKSCEAKDSCAAWHSCACLVWAQVEFSSLSHNSTLQAGQFHHTCLLLVLWIFHVTSCLWSCSWLYPRWCCPSLCPALSGSDVISSVKHP